MRRILTTVLAGLLVLAVVAPVFAWEFSLTGEYHTASSISLAWEILTSSVLALSARPGSGHFHRVCRTQHLEHGRSGESTVEPEHVGSDYPRWFCEMGI